MSNKLSIKDLPVKGKKVLVRVDFNVPMDSKGHITDDTRIKASLSTIQYILDQDGSVILMSHLGRPKGKKVPDLSLAPCAERLSQLLGKPVIMASGSTDEQTVSMVKELKSGQIILLENLRFNPAEEDPKKDPSFAKILASLGDVYVNDAFGTAHRAHSSTATIAKYFPNAAAAGFLLEKEIKFLGSTLLEPKRPFYAIVGGSKISSKIGVLKSLVEKADVVLVGGGMAYTFYKSLGIEIGQSICEDDRLSDAKEILELAKKRRIRFLLPIDNVISDKISFGGIVKVVATESGIPSGMQGVDIGPKTVELFTNELKNAATIFWNGPLGVFEEAEFAKGTQAIAKIVAGSRAVTVIGGGDSIAAVQGLSLAEKITHLSTGGGATLEYLELGKLPGIEALSESK